MQHLNQKMVANELEHSKTYDGPEEPSIIWRFFNYLHGILLIIVRFILEKKNGKHGKSMPPIDNNLLLESATSLAEMIRTKQVKYE